tara:strand:+ start:3163 stop:3732 length:570 start_codon:yes stop_codon:yes gene_type:complete
MAAHSKVAMAGASEGCENASTVDFLLTIVQRIAKNAKELMPLEICLPWSKLEESLVGLQETCVLAGDTGIGYGYTFRNISVFLKMESTYLRENNRKSFLMTVLIMSALCDMYEYRDDNSPPRSIEGLQDPDVKAYFHHIISQHETNSPPSLASFCKSLRSSIKEVRFSPSVILVVGICVGKRQLCRTKA